MVIGCSHADWKKVVLKCGVREPEGRLPDMIPRRGETGLESVCR